MANKCVTTLIFKDGKKEVRRTLEEFVQLQKGDVIYLHNPVEDKSDIGTLLVGGEYKVQEIDRTFYEEVSRIDVEGFLEIKYSLSRKKD